MKAILTFFLCEIYRYHLIFCDSSPGHEKTGTEIVPGSKTNLIRNMKYDG
jgi:hypothetical protein